MEKIINYKLKDFLRLKNVELIESYLSILDNLRPLKSITNPNYRWFKKKPKTLQIIPVRDLIFADVISIRIWITENNFDSIYEIFKQISGLNKKQILNLGVVQFYGIFSFIKIELEEISNMEINELQPDEDDFDIDSESVNANERMARFGILNLIDNLANGDVLKWQEIQQLPYMTVFTKLKMDKEKNKILKEISELQRKKQLKN